MSLLMGWDLYRLDILESSYSILMQELELIVLRSFGTMCVKTHLTKEFHSECLRVSCILVILVSFTSLCPCTVH
jgi:hypothetical protein